MSKPFICLAPLMGYSDTHFCYLMRLIAPNLRLYTEMLHANAVVHGDKHLAYANQAHFLACQLGGSETELLAKAAVKLEQARFNEINLNLGCPSERVQRGRFGACLMKEPSLVAECIQALCASVAIPITIKCRIGVDDYDDLDYLLEFVDKVTKAGCNHWIVHARNAWLKGLSPKENRCIPPLEYHKVHALKNANPAATIIINGGINNISSIKQQLEHVDGAMIGRWAIENPWAMRAVNAEFFPGRRLLSRAEVIASYLLYLLESKVAYGKNPSHFLRHLSHIFHATPQSKSWRRHLAKVKILNNKVVADLVGSINNGD